MNGRSANCSAIPARAHSTVADYLGAGGPIEVTGAAEYFRLASGADPAAIAARGRSAGAALGEDPTGDLRGQAEATASLLDTAADGATAGSPFGVIALAEYLPTRTFELVVHTCDLATATDQPLSPPAAPAVSALRLAGALAGPRAGEVLLALTGRRSLPDGYSVLAATSS